jgi:tripartite-type tricarboxylate transporter receptor subunit TctC
MGRCDRETLQRGPATKLPRRRFLQLAGAAAAFHAVPRRATAQAWPNRPLRWVVGYPAGGSTDLAVRIMGQWISERLGQPVIVENRPGAGTNLATQAVVNAPPDGYTLLLAVATNAINATLYDSLPFNFLRDIAPVAGVAEFPLVIEVAAAVPAKNLAEFTAYAKANPGRLNIASFGTGTISHLAIEMFKAAAGVDMVHVPYRGGAVMITDMLGGRIQAGVDALPNSLPQIQRGTLRALALTNAARSPVLPDVPTVGETIPGFEVTTWSGIGVPRGTPAEIIERLNRENNAGLADPAIKARLAEVGATPIVMTPAAFGAMMAADTAKWARIVKLSGVKPE